MRVESMLYSLGVCLERLEDILQPLSAVIIVQANQRLEGSSASCCSELPFTVVRPVGGADLPDLVGPKVIDTPMLAPPGSPLPYRPGASMETRTPCLRSEPTTSTAHLQSPANTMRRGAAVCRHAP